MRPVASLSLDLDNEWSYLKTRGDASWQSFPSYLDTVVPRVLEELARRSLRITVFVVGQDAALTKNHAALASLSSGGHEIGNHSFRHEPWLHRYTEDELDEELARAEDAILAATGAHTRGFRGPGYSLSRDTLRVLVRRGYEYDASTLPTYLGPLARAVYFRRTALQADERRDRDLLFGTFSDGRRSLKPYRWRVDDSELLELPVTTLPGIKVPMHVSYVLWLAGYSPRVAVAYFRNALRLCKLASVEPSILLHPLDFLGPDDAPSLSFFPGMGTALGDKLRVTGECLDILNESFDVHSVGEHAVELARRSDLRLVEPRFAEVVDAVAA